LTSNKNYKIIFPDSNADGWMIYPRDFHSQEMRIKEWRELISESREWSKPFMQPLYIDLVSNSDFKPQGIHLGIRTGTDFLIEYLNAVKSIGVNHVALNLRFISVNLEQTLELLAEKEMLIFIIIRKKRKPLRLVHWIIAH